MIAYITDPDRKAAIAREILEALPDWFGMEESREAYIRESRAQPFWAELEDGGALGFLALKETSPYTAELAVMGVLPEHHRKGVGRRLFEAFRQYAKERGYEFLQVKTVRDGCYADYDRTNAFYRGVGFRELECLPTLWGEENPCQLYVMAV